MHAQQDIDNLSAHVHALSSEMVKSSVCTSHMISSFSSDFENVKIDHQENYIAHAEKLNSTINDLGTNTKIGINRL